MLEGEPMDLDKLKKIIEMFNEGGLTKLKIRGVEGDFEELELKKDQPAVFFEFQLSKMLPFSVLGLE